MAQNKYDWDDLGRSIQDIVDRAINSHDYRKLNQTIHQVVDKAVDKGSQAVRKAMDGVSASSHHQPKRPVVVEQQNLPVLYGNTNGKNAVGILKTVGGGLLSLVSFPALISAAILNLFTGSGLLTFSMGVAMAGLGAGIWLLGSGIRTLGMVSRFKAYRNTLGQKTYCSLEKLARCVGKSEKFVRKELWKMIGAGLFLQGHMDMEQTCLITSDETFRHYEQSRLQLEERLRLEAEAKRKKEENPPTPQVKEVLDRGNAFVAQIRKCNDDIPGEEISRKISHMEMIVQRIFERAEAAPEIVPDLKKMMDYYLPMTVKLLNAYAEMDAQPVQGETIQSSKREIEQTLDTLNRAYEKLMDDLFKDTAMDVSSDISVLNTLLAQEGLTEDDFTKMKKQQNL